MISDETLVDALQYHLFTYKINILQNVIRVRPIPPPPTFKYSPLDRRAILYHYHSVYEKLFETPDIMSDVLELCVGHFHTLPDIFMFFYS